jgi:hypothetical protein
LALFYGKLQYFVVNSAETTKILIFYSETAPNERQNVAYATDKGPRSTRFFPLCPPVLSLFWIINSRSASTIMFSITVELSEYVSGSKTIFGQQCHFKAFGLSQFTRIFQMCPIHSVAHTTTQKSLIVEGRLVEMMIEAFFW